MRTRLGHTNIIGGINRHFEYNVEFGSGALLDIRYHSGATYRLLFIDILRLHIGFYKRLKN